MTALDPFGMGSVTEPEFQERYHIWHQAREESRLRAARREVASMAPSPAPAPPPPPPPRAATGSTARVASNTRGEPPRALPVFSQLNVAQRQQAGAGPAASLSVDGGGVGDVPWAMGR